MAMEVVVANLTNQLHGGTNTPRSKSSPAIKILSCQGPLTPELAGQPCRTLVLANACVAAIHLHSKRARMVHLPWLDFALVCFFFPKEKAREVFDMCVMSVWGSFFGYVNCGASLGDS